MKKSLLLLVLVFGFIRSSYGEIDRFYTKKDGLAGTIFHDLMQDTKGYLWICTRTGLTRFDGYNFETYQHDENDSSSLNSTTATTAFEDKKGRIWIGTNMGLNLYNPKTDCFKRIKLCFNNFQIITSVKTILENSSGLLYLITSNGLVRYNPDTNEQYFFNIKFETNGYPSFTQFNTALIDPDENVWIARNHAELSQWWQRACHSNLITLDIETHHGFITCIGFSHDGREAVSVPLLVGARA